MNAYKKLEKIFAKLSHLNHLNMISCWDEAVMMPVGGGEARTKAVATLQSICHQILTDPKNKELIEKAKEESLEDIWQKQNLFWIEKKYTNATCLPEKLVHETVEATMRCEQAWRSLRKENNWKEFKPLLEKVFTLVKESATIRAELFNKTPYDVLIDEYSPDINQEIIDPIFTKLKQELPILIQQALTKQQQEKIIMPQGNFPAEIQKQLGLELMRAIGFDFDHGRLDVSHHPFCGGVPQDVRITTRYYSHEFITSAMAICHETGHAKYEQALPQKWLDQPVGQALGMSIHESQSLLVEMQACRSKEFMHFLSTLVKKYFGNHKAYSAENLYRLYTQVKPGYIRVDADELTYPLHVIIRYELEQALMTGALRIADLPEAWDNKMKTYLNLSTKDNYKDGVMQDVHWPSGAFGYFPAYTLGSLIAAQLFTSAKKTHPNLLEELSTGNFSSLFSWLARHVHSRASSISCQQLIKEATGEKLNSKFFLDHAKERYVSNTDSF